MNTYLEGMEAYREGKEMFENPYAKTKIFLSLNDFTDWLAGWMYAKQLDRDGPIDQLGRGDSGNA